MVEVKSFNGGLARRERAPDVSNHVEKAHGPVVQARDIGYLIVESARRRVRAIYHDRQETVASTFVAGDSSEFEALCRAISAKGCGVILGEPESGRTSAAITALHRAGREVGLIRADNADDDPFAGVYLGSGQGGLIDISGLGEPGEDFLTALRDFVARMTEASAALVIVADRVQWVEDLVPGAVHQNTVRPPMRTVFHSHLSYLLKSSHDDEEVSSIAHRWSGDHRVMELLEGGRLREAETLAQVVSNHASTDSEEHDAFVKEIRRDFLRRGRDAADWFERNGGEEGVWNRVVITALALLEGRSVRRVLDGARRLAEELVVPAKDAGGIAGSGITASLEAVRARRYSDGTAHFHKSGFGALVLDHLWSDHDAVRTTLVRWATAEALWDRGEFAGVIARRLWDLFERHGETEEVVSLFNTWSASPALVSPAVFIGAGAALHPRFGQRMRRRFYDLARTSSSSDIAIPVIQACAIYGEDDPSSALTRLKWFADSSDEDVRAETIEALRSLAGRIPEKRVTLAFQVLEWTFRDPSEERRGVVHDFLAHLLELMEESVPSILRRHVLAPNESEGQTVALMWHELLDRGDRDLVARALGPWIDTALRTKGYFDDVAILLACAVTGFEGDSEENVNRRLVDTERLLDKVCVERGIDLDDPDLYRLHRCLRARGDVLLSSSEEG